MRLCLGCNESKDKRELIRVVKNKEGEIFIDKTLKAIQTTLKSKTIITDKDLDRAIIKELKKYNPDLAYVYENRDKII